MPEPQRITPRIMVTTDFSDESEHAFFLALALAVARQARLTLLHTGSESRDAIPWGQFPGVRETLTRWGLLPPDAPRSAVAETLKVGIAKMAMRDSNPRLGISDYLRKHPTDLLVMATERRAGLARLLRPSVAETVCHRTRSHTLMLPRRGLRLVDAGSGRRQLRRVLYVAAVDRDPRADLAFIGQWLPGLAADELEVTLLLAENDAAAWPYALPSIARTRWLVEQRPGPGTAAIIRAARAMEAQLVVLPTRRRLGVVTRLRGSETDALLRALHVPLLAIPDL